MFPIAFHLFQFLHFRASVTKKEILPLKKKKWSVYNYDFIIGISLSRKECFTWKSPKKSASEGNFQCRNLEGFQLRYLNLTLDFILYVSICFA